MTPEKLAEYVFAVGMTLSSVLWVNLIVLSFMGFFDRRNDE